VVATVLYFLYTRLHTVPGHRDLAPATGRHAAGAPRPSRLPLPSRGVEATRQPAACRALAGTEGMEDR
jgi:hypothetical protein